MSNRDELPEGHWIKTARETGQRIKKTLDDYEEGISNGAPRHDPFVELDDDDRDRLDPEQPNPLRGR